MIDFTQCKRVMAKAYNGANGKKIAIYGISGVGCGSDSHKSGSNDFSHTKNTDKEDTL